MIIETDRIYEPVVWSNEDPYIRYDEVYRAIAEEGEIISIMKNIRILIRAEADEERIVCTKHKPKEKE